MSKVTRVLPWPDKPVDGWLLRMVGRYDALQLDCGHDAQTVPPGSIKKGAEFPCPFCQAGYEAGRWTVTEAVTNQPGGTP